MRGNRCLTRGNDERVEVVRGEKDADRCNPDGSAAPIVSRGDPLGIVGLVKLPQRTNAGMHALPAGPQHLPADARMHHLPITDDRPRDGDRALRVVGRLADPPLVLRVSGVARDDVTGWSFKATNPFCVPSGDLLAREHLGLLADGVSGRNPHQAPANALGGRDVPRISRGVR
jgi:hypothetical protein